MADVTRTTNDSIHLSDGELEALETFLLSTCAGKTIDADLAEIVERIDQFLGTALPANVEEF